DKNITLIIFFFSSRRRHTRFSRDWSSDVCSSDLIDCGFPQWYQKSFEINVFLLVKAISGNAFGRPSFQAVLPEKIALCVWQAQIGCYTPPNFNVRTQQP